MKSPESKCWARAASECGGKLSREHPFARGTFREGTVDFINIAGSNSGRRRLSIDAVTVKCLCEHHNNALSKVDQAGIDVVNCIRRGEELLEVRRARPRRWRWHELKVDGFGFERWVLKTAINLAHIRREETWGWSPPENLVRAVFGQKPLPSGAGLAAFGVAGHQLHFGDRMAFWFLLDRARREVGGAVLIVHGWPFVITWQRPVQEMFPLEHEGTVFERSSCVYHVKKLQHGDVKLRLRLDWSGKWRERDHRRVVALRGRYAPPPRR